MYPHQSSIFKKIITASVLLVFSVVVVQADQLAIHASQQKTPHKFVSAKEESGALIQLNQLDLIPVEAADGVRRHRVKRGEMLSQIAAQYGTTVAKIKQANNIQGSSLKVGQELFISTVPGIVHTLKKDTNFLLFANQYKLPLEDLLTLNYATQEELPLYAQTEIYLPITIEKAYELGLEEKPAPPPKPKPVVAVAPKPRSTKKITKPTVVKPQPTQTVTTPKKQPVVQKKQPETYILSDDAYKNQKQPEKVEVVVECGQNECLHKNKCFPKPASAICAPQDTNNAWVCEDGYTDTGRSCIADAVYEKQNNSNAYHGKVIARWYDNSKVSNGFYKGNCTHWAAKRRPDIFPYTSSTTQSRPFGGNAKAWYYNAKAAGYSVGYNPVPGCIAVYGSSRGRGYGHVGIVKQVTPNLILLEDENGPGGYGVVTQWWVNRYDSGYMGCIY